MLKLSVLLLVGSWLNFPRDFVHQKFQPCSQGFSLKNKALGARLVIAMHRNKAGKLNFEDEPF